MATEASKSRDVKIINLIDDEESNIVAKLRSEIAELVNERANLKKCLYAFECENTDLKLQLKEKDSVLKDTQAMLGQYVVAANRQVQADPVAGPSRRPGPSLKRARSPSFEILDMPEPAHKKGKEKETFPRHIPTVTPADPTSKTRSRTIPFVSVPPRKTVTTPIKSETTSRPHPSSSSSKVVKLSPSEQKHRKIELEPEKNPKPAFALQSVAKDAAPRQGNKDSPTAATSSSTSSMPSSTPANSKLTSEQANPLVEGKAKSTASSSNTSSSTSSSAVDKLQPTTVSANPQIKEDKVKTNIKVKDVFTLPASTIKHYLESAKALTVTPPPLDLEVPRTFLRLAYGGSDQQFLQFIQEDLNPSGPVQRRIVFPMLDMNPAMPSVPGEPGLVFASRHEILSDPPWTLFCKLSNAAPAVWRYLGEYESFLCGTMTAEQFKIQTPVTKVEWAKLILKTKAFDVYVAMRARIALRKAGTFPIEDKEKEEKLVKAEMRAIKNKKGRPLTEKDVVDAFSNGDEGIDIIRMTCVKYDHVFANDMKAKFANYDILIAANERKKAEGKDKKAGGSRQSPTKRGRKSKAQTQTESMNGDEDEQRDPNVAGDSDDEYEAPSADDASTSTSAFSAAEPRPRRTTRKSAALVVDYSDEISKFIAFVNSMDDDDDDDATELRPRRTNRKSAALDVKDHYSDELSMDDDDDD